MIREVSVSTFRLLCSLFSVALILHLVDSFSCRLMIMPATRRKSGPPKKNTMEVKKKTKPHSFEARGMCGEEPKNAKKKEKIVQKSSDEVCMCMCMCVWMRQGGGWGWLRVRECGRNTFFFFGKGHFF